MEKYIKTKVLKDKLEEEFKLDFHLLKQRILACDVCLSKKNITEYLESRYQGERPNNYLRSKERSKINYPTISILDLENDQLYGLSEFKDKDKSIEKVYLFREEQFDNFKEVISAYKKKCLILVSIISFYLNENINDDTLLEMISFLDIKFDGSSISSRDFDRLFEPTIYNLRKLFEITDLANNYKTYFNNKELFEIPSILIQVNDIDMDETGFIPLSDNQRKNLFDVKKYVKRSS